MNRVTLAVIAVLLAVPAVAQAKAGVEFPTQPHAKKEQTFTVIVHGAGGGGRPLTTFRSDSSGQVLRVRTAPLNRNGESMGTVVLVDRGPWTATVSLHGRVVSPGGGPGFVATPVPAPPAAAPPAADHSDGGLPAWLLTIPAALIAAFGIWLLRRRPRELGA
jgi:hypothetical protein